MDSQHDTHLQIGRIVSPCNPHDFDHRALAVLPLPFFFFNDTATTEIYTLSLHDALPIFPAAPAADRAAQPARGSADHAPESALDRKSTRLNSSHQIISYAVFCLKKKKRRFPIDCETAADQRDQRHDASPQAAQRAVATHP